MPAFAEAFTGALCVAIAVVLWVAPETEAAAATVWTEASTLTLEGRGFTDTATPYDRLPASAEGVVPPAVWGLSLNSSGMCVRFVTDATTISLRWEVRDANLAMPHMPATGVSGLDLYARGPEGWRFVGNGRPAAVTNEATMYPGKADELALYLPLYNGVKSVQIGVPEGSSLAPAPDRGKPVVFYGTSITQGGCASRPGMAYPAIFGRSLNVPTINLGFSGSGQMEPELADLLGRIDARVFVLDALWNMSPEMVAERYASFVRKLRQARPDVPIVFAEDCNIRNVVPTEKGRMIREILTTLQAEGITGLYFVSADGMMGPNDEGAVDGCHPTDLGFWYQAGVFARELEPLVGKP